MTEKSYVLVGVDVVDIDRFRRSLERSPGLRVRLFTSKEQEIAQAKADPVPYLASRFAAKEAVMKLLGRGVGGIPFVCVEVASEASRRPLVILHGAAVEIALSLGVEDIDISLSHSRLTAIAHVSALARFRPSENPRAPMEGVKPQ